MNDIQTQTIYHIPVARVHQNPWQTREALDPAKVQARADDFKLRGMLQTPLARPKHPALRSHSPTKRSLSWYRTEKTFRMMR